MGGVVLLFRFIFGIPSFLFLGLAVLLGAVVYFLMLFRFDRNLRNEIGDLLRTLGIL
jgi:Tfp pilus assembly protein PilN